MTQPTYGQFKSLSSSTNGLSGETRKERIISCLAVLVSGQNPDGTPYTP